MEGPAQVFDRRLVRHRRERAVRAGRANFLFDEAADRLTDRLADIRRTFPLALDLSGHNRCLTAATIGDAAIGTIVQAGLARPPPTKAADLTVALDEEALPFGANAFDLIVSCLGLHTVNDLPGTLLQIRRALKPDGLFLAVMLGGDTLHELRQAWLAAEAQEEGGASPRVAPFAQLKDAAALLQRAGFALPVADLDRLTVTYGDPLSLMADLRAMGETNAMHQRRHAFLRRGTLAATAAHYRNAFADATGRVPATFHLLYLTGWAPHGSQQQAMRPGSARHRLADALGST